MEIIRKFVVNYMLFFIVFLGVGIKKSSADFPPMGHIELKNLDSLKYEVRLYVYRDCRGIPLSNKLTWWVKGANTTHTFQSNAIRATIKSVSTTCSFTTPLCDPPNSSNSGWGLEEHMYLDTLDFLNDKGLEGFKNTCDIEVRVLACCVLSAVNTVDPQIYYTKVSFNKCIGAKNSTPFVNNKFDQMVNVGNAVYRSVGATDIDGDLITYELHGILDMDSTVHQYNTGYSLKEPIKVYYPNNLPSHSRIPNKKAKSPWGFSFDTLSGEMIFSPTNKDDYTGFMIKMKEWRKTKLGSYVLIGESYRLLSIVVRADINKSPQIITDRVHYEVCEGEKLCFEIKSKDTSYFNPYTNKLFTDSIKLNLLNGYTGVTFSKQNKLQQTATFCWQTKVGMGRTEPYFFDVEAIDNGCYINAKTTQVFRINVNPVVKGNLSTQSLSCGRYAVAFSANQPELKPIRTIKVLDLNHQEVDAFEAYFLSNDSALLRRKNKWDVLEDTLNFLQKGTYVIQATIANDLGCKEVYLDTVVIGDQLSVPITSGKDTLVCMGAEVTIQTGAVDHGVAPYQYRWSNQDNSASTKVILDTSLKIMELELEDATGCVSRQQIRLYANDYPKVNLGEDQVLCGKMQTQITPQYPSTTWWTTPADSVVKGEGMQVAQVQWIQDGQTLSLGFYDTLKLNQSTQISIHTTDALGCESSDTVQVFVNESFVAEAGPDLNRCWNDFKLITANTLPNTKNKQVRYRWTDINTDDVLSLDSTYVWSAIDTATVELSIKVEENGFWCEEKDTVQLTAIPYIPITMPSSRQMCCDAENINLDAQMPAAPKGGEWYAPYKANLVQNGVFRPLAGCHPTETAMHTVYYEIKDPEHGCHSIDSVLMRVHPLPQVQMAEIKYCQDPSSIALKDYILTENNESGGVQKFACWDCNGYKEEDILKDIYPLDPVKNEYILEVQKDKYTPKNGYDSIRLSYTYTSKHGCSNTDMFYVGIGTYPTIEIPTPRYINSDAPISPNGRICKEEEGIRLGGLPEGGQWQITPQTNPLLITGGIFNSAVADSGVSYKLTYTYQHPQSGCTSHKNLYVDVICNGITSVWTPDRKENIHIPNAFTPFNEGVNNSFKPLYYGHEKVQFNVFNRQGVLVFQTENIETGWDGMYQGKEAPAGTYVYQLILAPGTANEQLMQGTFMLLR